MAFKDPSVSFIKRLKAFEETISSRDFDFIGINSRIEDFGRRHMMDQRTIVGAQTVFEELGVQTILPRLGDQVDLRVTIEYSEETGHAQLRLFYNGGFDPLADTDRLSGVLIDNVSVETEYMALTEDAYTDCVKVKLK